jgi:SsrA-binding protein
MKVYTENKKVRFDYEIVEEFEAGIELKGFEVKSIKSGKANLVGGFVLIRDSEAWATNIDIPPYQANNTPEDYDHTRTRKLLLNQKEIARIENKVKSEKLTIVPIRLYNKGGLVKLSIGLARGKKKHDKREIIKKRETKRVIERTLKK